MNTFTKQNVSYNKIKADAEQKTNEGVEGDVKSITLMTSTSKKLIQAMYNGQKEETAKLLEKYIWFGTRDSTMILMTAGLLALAEKEAEKETEEGQINLVNDKQNITNLLKYMAEGDGAKAKQACEKAQGFEKAFKTILKSAPNIKKNENKANDIWTKYVKQIGKITKWWIGLYALKHNVVPALEKTLATTYYNAFVNNIPDSKKKTTKEEAKPKDEKPAEEHTPESQDAPSAQDRKEEKNKTAQPEKQPKTEEHTSESQDAPSAQDRKEEQNTTNDFEEALKNKNFEKVIEILDNPEGNYWDTLKVSHAKGLAEYLRTPQHKTINLPGTEVAFTAELVTDLSNLAKEYKFDDENYIDKKLREDEDLLLFPTEAIAAICTTIMTMGIKNITESHIGYCEKVNKLAQKYRLSGVLSSIEAIKKALADPEQTIQGDDVTTANAILTDLGVDKKMKATMKFSEILDLSQSIREVYHKHRDDADMTRKILEINGILKKYQ